MGIFENLKDIGKVLQEAGKIEQYSQILDAQERLIEMQKKIGELEEENKSLKEQLKIKESLIFEMDSYWINEKDRKTGPFCSRCWDGELKLVRLLKTSEPGYCRCPNCKTNVWLK